MAYAVLNGIFLIMEKILEIISKTPIFNGLSEDQLKAMRSIAEDQFYDKGKIIFMEGDEGNGFYIVAAGKVKIYKVSMDGKEQILHIYGPGNPFGEVSVFSGLKFPAVAEALIKSHILFFPKDSFISLLSKNPSLALKILALLSRRLRQFTLLIENLSLKEVPGRLAAYFISLSEEQDIPDILTLPVSKGQLSSLLGTIPETMSRILSRMSKDGLIEVNGREIKILNNPGLEELAEYGKLL